ncbi:MAG: peptidase M50 [Methanomicrobiales archaeon]|nr:peptidase M50 [Methanomicrobiales archaeon]
MFERIPPREWRDLILAWFAISIAFSLIYVRGGIELLDFLMVFALSAITVGAGFILHELAHKFMAMRYGFWAEFRKDNLMLLVAVAMAALAGVVFAAPGATIIYGPAISKEQNGRISIVGPLTNLLLCIPFGALAFLPQFAPAAAISLPLLTSIGAVGFQVNAMIAVFNMLPVSVLDGKKVLAWNPLIFAATIGISLVVLLVALGFSPL